MFDQLGYRASARALCRQGEEGSGAGDGIRTRDILLGKRRVVIDFESTCDASEEGDRITCAPQRPPGGRPVLPHRTLEPVNLSRAIQIDVNGKMAKSSRSLRSSTLGPRASRYTAAPVDVRFILELVPIMTPIRSS